MTDHSQANVSKALGAAQAGFPNLWPYAEARKLVERLEGKPKDGPLLFETGYGPSGLPHIGTFGEVARTTWVRKAFTEMTGLPSRLLAFSDDMDALRKVPGNVPNQEMLAKHLGQPLSRIPDPFGTHESFAAHNNAMLRDFLDAFGFDYEFASASDYYASGRFDVALKRVLEVHDDIVKVIAPTLREERRATYSPVLPIHPETGEVMQVPIIKADPEAGTVVWKDPATGKTHETSVYGGHAKMQWKADWAMRWYALGVDYEMSGKDLTDSVKLSSRICRLLGGNPPENLTYELFLDAEGRKISKSKGNGLSVEEWLRYGTPESLGQFMFQAPTRAKRLHFDVIPKATDEYLGLIERSRTQEGAAYHANPVRFVHGQLDQQGRVPEGAGSPVAFSTLLNLAGVANASEAATLWKFIRRYDSALSPESQPYLAALVERAVAYYNERVKPGKRYRAPDARERQALAELADALEALPATTTPEAVQNTVFEIGKRHFDKKELRAWFGCLYEVLLGQSDGPRFGVFAALYGLPETVQLIRGGLAGTLGAPATPEAPSQEGTAP
ncbi:lysine--tRNA ligase [Formicincola oecophyllae]|uniref:Lysine--tRNA ligase n=1 Tax=Formicincola oecophyllae TaxID=2558361 RepID=A0A4Y6UDI3_9PROT|nr:lysine--tRNA ligase [Formicincola oecophyllae]